MPDETLHRPPSSLDLRDATQHSAWEEIRRQMPQAQAIAAKLHTEGRTIHENDAV